MFSKIYSFVNEQFAAEINTQFCAFRFNYQALLFQARKKPKIKNKLNKCRKNKYIKNP